MVLTLPEEEETVVPEGDTEGDTEGANVLDEAPDRLVRASRMYWWRSRYWRIARRSPIARWSFTPSKLPKCRYLSCPPLAQVVTPAIEVI